MLKTLIVIVGLTFCATPASINVATAQSKPCTVQKIYVAEFGTDPRHINFRLALEKWLSKEKFLVTKGPADADAVLTGSLSISSGKKYSYLALRDAELKTAIGEKPWRADFDFRTKNAFGWLGRGHIENGAKRIAEDIRASCK